MMWPPLSALLLSRSPSRRSTTYTSCSTPMISFSTLLNPPQLLFLIWRRKERNKERKIKSPRTSPPISQLHFFHPLSLYSLCLQKLNCNSIYSEALPVAATRASAGDYEYLPMVSCLFNISSAHTFHKFITLGIASTKSLRVSFLV